MNTHSAVAGPAANTHTVVEPGQAEGLRSQLQVEQDEDLLLRLEALRLLFYPFSMLLTLLLGAPLSLERSLDVSLLT